MRLVVFFIILYGILFGLARLFPLIIDEILVNLHIVIVLAFLFRQLGISQFNIIIELILFAQSFVFQS